MPREKEFRVLVATDGSHDAEAAVATTVHFPWPARTRVRVISARRTTAPYRRSILLSALDRAAEMAVESAARALSRRWPEVEAGIPDRPPVAGILREAERFEPDVIVAGWRGHGPIRRLLMGSVSRGIVRRATCPVLVVKQRQHVRKLVVGFDGSPSAKRALAFVNRLAPPRNGHVTLVAAVELMTLPSGGRIPGAATIASEIRRQNEMRSEMATQDLERAAAALESCGWSTRTALVHGEPLRELLRAVALAHAQVLVVGARGTSGVRHLLLGSVADGALSRSPVAVLVAR